MEHGPQADIFHLPLGELVQLIQNGQSEAHEALAVRVRKPLWGYIMKLVSGNEALANDLYQETYMRAIQDIYNLKDPERVVYWMRITARNLFFDHWRSPKNKGHDDLSNLDEDHSQPERDNETNMAVQQVLSQIAPETRHILILVDMEGHSYAEAAEIIGISENAVRSRLHRARQSFQLEYKNAA